MKGLEWCERLEITATNAGCESHHIVNILCVTIHWGLSLHSVSKPEPSSTTMGDRYMNLLLNQLSLNWNSTNTIEKWKCFQGQVELLFCDRP